MRISLHEATAHGRAFFRANPVDAKTFAKVGARFVPLLGEEEMLREGGLEARQVITEIPGRYRSAARAVSSAKGAKGRAAAVAREGARMGAHAVTDNLRVSAAVLGARGAFRNPDPVAEAEALVTAAWRVARRDYRQKGIPYNENTTLIRAIALLTEARALRFAADRTVR